MKMILRQALKRDLPAVRKIFNSWADLDPTVAEALETSVESKSQDTGGRCRVLESDKTVSCAVLWVRETPEEVRLVAFGSSVPASYAGIDSRSLREQILDWADMGVSRVRVTVPEAICSEVVGALRACGFMFEGMTSSFSLEKTPSARLCKHFLYDTVPQAEVLNFLREMLISLGCEVRNEGEGFGFRIRSEFRLPFIFSPWHRASRSGSDIIVHPPARVLEFHELETLFFPLSIRARNEMPLLVHLDKRIAGQMIDLPYMDALQGSLFGRAELSQHRDVKINDLTYTNPPSLRGMRKGLPLLFYVNKIGAVGAARVENWYLDEPKNLYNQLDDMSRFDPEDVKEHAAGSGPRAGKVLAIRFQWYRPFSRPVALEEIRSLDDSFNPQRTRLVSSKLYQAILTAGNRADKF